MDSRNIFLSSILFAAIGLAGCQTVKTDSMLSTSDANHEIKPVIWEKSGEAFHERTNNDLATNESRVVFFRNSNEHEQSDNINIGIGSNNLFQASLKNGHYSDAIICSGSQIINVGKLNQESGKVISHSKNYQLIPQTTTYLQVGLSVDGSAVIEQIPADEALLLLNQKTRQAHQISRVLMNCNITIIAPTLIRESIVATVVDNLEIKNPVQFNVLFDFDSAGIKSNHFTVLDGMANFIQSYPQMAVTLEGHTDNRGSESYNRKLSESRSSIVKNVLVDHYGIEAMRLRAIGYGETRPVDTNNTEQGRQNNRRVVAIVSQGNN